MLTDSEGNEIYAGFWRENVYHGEGRLFNTSQEEMADPLDYTDLKSINNGWAIFEGSIIIIYTLITRLLQGG